eukprot:GHVN01039355.1.p1 GENE.GHVN01039355.1~~GHVN01039355.1.p1  ORF type:complete len:103 (+),score=8.23 GHVN01039355.1:92-400(+)
MVFKRFPTQVDERIQSLESEAAGNETQSALVDGCESKLLQEVAILLCEGLWVVCLMMICSILCLLSLALGWLRHGLIVYHYVPLNDLLFSRCCVNLSLMRNL